MLCSTFEHKILNLKVNLKLYPPLENYGVILLKLSICASFCAFVWNKRIDMFPLN